MADRKNKKNQNENNKVSVNKLLLLFTVVDRKKADFYADVIQSFEVNFQFSVYGEGTAKKEILDYLGLANSEKAIIISVIKESNTKKALNVLQEKFDTVKNGKGISFTVPLSSVIGKSVFGFLSNNNNIKESLK